MPRHEFTPAEAAAAGRRSGLVRQRKAEERQRIEAEDVEQVATLCPPSEASAEEDDTPNTEPLQERRRPTRLEDIVLYGYSP